MQNLVSSVSQNPESDNLFPDLTFSIDHLCARAILSLRKTSSYCGLSIAFSLSSSKLSQQLLDSRISSYCDWVKLKNVTTTYFRKGVTAVLANSSMKDKSQTTGGGGGYRSCEFVSLLLQLFFAVSLL